MLWLDCKLSARKKCSYIMKLICLHKNIMKMVLVQQNFVFGVQADNEGSEQLMHRRRKVRIFAFQRANFRIWLKVSFLWEILDKFDSFGIPRIHTKYSHPSLTLYLILLFDKTILLTMNVRETGGWLAKCWLWSDAAFCGVWFGSKFLLRPVFPSM